jgi:phosphoglycerate dehydrogenase-like enzyme
MKIVFHGKNASTFRETMEELLPKEHEIAVLPDVLDSPADIETYRSADVIVGIAFNKATPVPHDLRLYQVPGAGYDGIDIEALPATAALCNCFGHENAIAEYVFAALLARHVPLADANSGLRKGDWTWWAGGPAGLRSELGMQTIGILGFGHIGKTLAARARAFGMRLTVANRSAVSVDGADEVFTLDRLREFMGSADIIVNTLPLAENTRSLIGGDELSAMRGDGVIVNVGRGAVIDEHALYTALREKRIGGAIIDTWYVYPNAGNPAPQPSDLPFRDLDNVVMTPHMSGWTYGTVQRRRETIADNINAIASGATPQNLIRR